ncbi:MAG TPA: rod shape-determining protein [bacterium]|nr:rod shape-determining protein [bacterium]
MPWELERLLRKDLIVDPGSVNTVLASRRLNFLLREPTQITLYAPRFGQGTGLTRIAEFGAGLLAREPKRKGVYRVQPVQRGLLVDTHAMNLLLEALLRKAHFQRSFPFGLPSRVAVVIPAGLTAQQNARFEEFAQDIGPTRPTLIQAPFAAAAGSGLDTQANRGRVLVDFGGGKTYAAVFCLGGIVAYSSQPCGSQDLTLALRDYVAQRWTVDLSMATADEVKHTIGSVYPLEQPASIGVRGIDPRTGFEKKVTLDDNELRDVLIDAFEPVVMAIQRSLADLPAEMAGDIQADGVTLTGGGSLLHGLASFLEERLNLPFHLAPDPINATILGAQTLLLQHPSRAAAALM